MLERLAIDRGAILFDPERVAVPGDQLFDPGHWHAQGALTEQAGGRGSIQYIDNDAHRWVMRRYLRGGMAARFARDRYLWLGEKRSRSFRELRLLAAGRMDDARWAAIGRCLRHFHDAGVQHADLNAHNIMLGEKREVWVLDFDRGRLREPGHWSAGVLDRLARSLAKIGGDAADWRVGFALLRLAHDA